MNEKQKSDLVIYRFSNAKKTLTDIDLLIKNKLWNIAINRIYYACYYAVSALLIQQDIQTKTHSGSLKMFSLHFLKTGIVDERIGVFYAKIFNMRTKGDYEDFIDFEEKDVLILIDPAKEFINCIESIIFK